MKRKVMVFGAAARLSGGALFGFTSPTPTTDCPLKGTPDCPLVQNCAQAGTPT